MLPYTVYKLVWEERPIVEFVSSPMSAEELALTEFYAEFDEEGRELAKMGLADYARLLREEEAIERHFGKVTARLTRRALGGKPRKEIQMKEIQMSTWVFSCRMGLRQDDCGEYVEDRASRGAGRFGGCASCLHREPNNAETREAEDYYYCFVQDNLRQ